MPLVPNDESVNKEINQFFQNSRVPHVSENEADFLLVKNKFSICFSMPVLTETYKNIKKLANEIFKFTRSGKLDVEEDPRIERCVITKIQDKYNLTPKNPPVNYADTLLPITKDIQEKNECFPFRNMYSGKI